MYSVEESPFTATKRPQIQPLYPPTVLNEYIKCVVIGDSGVGKTCLITAWACDTDYNLDQLVKTHVSTVWAHDHYRNDKHILERSVVEVDTGYVALRLWDTFGYHDKDRGFAYRGADVVLLCFSLGLPRSLENIRKIWIPELRRRIPTTPVVIVGCQADLRYMYRDEAYQKIHKGLMYKVVQEKDIVTPEMGRAIAKEAGAPYYECSSYSRYGIEDVFLNCVRAAMVEKRKLRFWSMQLRRIQYPQIQPPMKLPPLMLPKVDIPAETLHDDLCQLLHNQSEGDVVFIVRGQCFRAHKICLAVSAKVFRDLFITSCAPHEKVSQTKKGGSLKRSSSSHSNRLPDSDENCLIDNEILPACTVNPDHPHVDDNINHNADVVTTTVTTHPAFLSVEERLCDNPFKPGDQMQQTFVTMNHEVTFRAFQYVLEYLYTGEAKEQFDCFVEVKVACSLLQLTDLAVMISNIESGEQFLNPELVRSFKEERRHHLRDIALKKEYLADVKFRVDDGIVDAHKPLMMARCEMMYAMFNDNFIEASAHTIELPGMSKDVFLALREFLYTGECPESATLNCLGIIEMADRLCLPRLVRLVESCVVEDLREEDRDGEDIIEDVLTLLEPAQLHNADRLSDWCMKYLCNHYLTLRQKYSKVFHKLRPDNIKFIEKNRWPPEWYIKELTYFETMQMMALRSKKQKGPVQQKQQFSRWEQCTSAAGCLCFCRRSKIVSDDISDPTELPA